MRSILDAAERCFAEGSLLGKSQYLSFRSMLTTLRAKLQFGPETLNPRFVSVIGVNRPLVS